MSSPRRCLAILSAAAAFVAACGGDDGDGPGVPTEAQARAAFEAKFDQAQAGDAAAFCGDTEIPDMCESQWERLGGANAVPKEKPRIASIREQDGYRVVRVCGQDGTGVQFRSDFVVGLEDGEVTYALPVFWNGASFSGVRGDDSEKIDVAQPSGSNGCP